VGFEPTISAGERPKTHALDRAATGTGNLSYVASYNYVITISNKYQILWLLFSSLSAKQKVT
jgi:hypothetical protein